MSFFGRATNLIKGGIKSLGRPDREGPLRERALEEELARLEAGKKARPAAPAAPADPAAKDPSPPPAGGGAAPDRGPPERDEHGNVKRTL